MPLNRQGRCSEKMYHLMVFCGTRKSPVVPCLGGEITLFYPASGLIRVSAFSPFPQRFDDAGVDVSEGFLATDMAMVVCPAADHGVELLDYRRRCRHRVLFERFPGLSQQVFDRFSSRFDDQLAVVFTDVLTQKIKTLFDRYNPCFLLRERQPAFGQESHDGGFDLLFQECFGIARDDKIVREANHVDLALGETLFQQRF